jgi:hypothetical protein
MAQAAAKKARDIEADWDVRATQAAIDAAKEVVSGGDINARASLGSLSEIEWGWIAAACVFAWIKTKAMQATTEGIGYDVAIRTLKGRDPEPWEAGAVATVLPGLADLSLPWGEPIGGWSKENMTSFAWHCHKLVDASLAARDEGASDKVVQRLSQPEVEREISAAKRGPLLARGELDDDIPF